MYTYIASKTSRKREKRERERETARLIMITRSSIDEIVRERERDHKQQLTRKAASAALRRGSSDCVASTWTVLEGRINKGLGV